MSYQVLARKWRPRTFGELVGQGHVVTALANALTQGRLHHAYLLTGTRGVGKTTVARVLAKCLNCEKGVSATPCGACAACEAIDAGRFVDLLELDAASNTGVDNMREILDNARYSPTVGRYKVYLIDEVHMLSKGAFNSMLKTLEEPPEHVKFILATTDPQKIPVTVLSRCLQFNLTALPRTAIAERLAHILTTEAIAHDAGALPLLAAAAQGSLRDALSLLDQAIAYGAGEVRESAVRAMLGAVDRDYLFRIIDALIANDGSALLAEVDQLATSGHGFAPALEELASLFYRIAIAQVAPHAADGEDRERINGYATRLSPEAVQLAYQICAQGRADLALAPDETTGFGMTLLRLLAFEPASSLATPNGNDQARGSTVEAGGTGESASSRRRMSASSPTSSAAIAEAPAARTSASIGNVQQVSGPSSRAAVASTSEAARPAADPATVRFPLPDVTSDWPAFVGRLKLTGMAAQLAAQSELRSIKGNALSLAIPASHKHLADKAYADKLKAALDAATGRKLLLAFEIGENSDGSLAALERRQREKAKAEGEAAFRKEPFVRDLVERFHATVRSETIAPLAESPSSKQEPR